MSIATMRLQYYLGVCGLPQGFRLYNATSGALLATMGPADRTFNLTALGLTEGVWPVYMTYVDQYGSESDPSRTLNILVDSGGTSFAYVRGVRNVSAAQLVGGSIRLTFEIEPKTAAADNPTLFQIALASDLSTILDTVSFDAQTVKYVKTFGPYTHGQTLTFAVRATDGTNYSPWVEGLPVVADAEGPEAPTIIEQDDDC